MNKDEGMPLFEAYARQTDPPTSKDAAKEANVPRLEAVTLLISAASYPAKMNWMQFEQSPVARRARIDRQSISPRWAPLRRKGYLETFEGERTKGHKKMQETHRITPEGFALLKRKGLFVPESGEITHKGFALLDNNWKGRI